MCTCVAWRVERERVCVCFRAGYIIVLSDSCCVCLCVQQEASWTAAPLHRCTAAGPKLLAAKAEGSQAHQFSSFFIFFGDLFLFFFHLGLHRPGSASRSIRLKMLHLGKGSRVRNRSTPTPDNKILLKIRLQLQET